MGVTSFTQCDLPHLPSQRQRRDKDRQLNELRATRDSLQTEVNENVPVETSGLDEALRVRDSPIQSQALEHCAPYGLGYDSRKGVLHGPV
jgi:hypothetical protein